MSVTATGSAVVFQINNAPVLYCNAVSYEESRNLQPLYTLDNVLAHEYYETTYAVRFTVNYFRVATQSAMSQGLIPTVRNILVQPELTATLIDKRTNQPIFRMERIKCNSESFDVSARELATSRLEFFAIKMTSDYN